jgi:hypothetical protein
MKRLAAILFLVAIATGFAFGQDWEIPEVLERMGANEEQIETVVEIFEETEREIQEARLEIEILKAQLRKLLFQEAVNMREVERLLRDSLDWELKERMAQIRRQVELRKVLADRMYARLMKRMQERRRWEENEEAERARRQREEEEMERREQSSKRQ